MRSSGQDIGGRYRDALRVQGRERLGGNLGEDQHHQRQHAGCNGDADFAEQAQADHRGHRRRQDIDQIVAEQDQANQAIRALQQFLRQPRAALTEFGAVREPIAINGHQTGFAAGEECGQEQQ